ncbi:hypothetical protein [Candidatus Protofrankia californiensis]|uniref:hypothetical protein n=1 Tax=Candidatus Protofrankia californiensis TaxID=1839754 RepID=UPI0010410D94|nr:hypothetical protein [Candidatus Protofrankia californiensis]
MALNNGLRRDALAGLRRRDVDLDHGTIPPTVPRVVVDNRAEDGEQKTDNAYRGRWCSTR